jgi:uncharacterized repeat protein (TIGR01451 family)
MRTILHLIFKNKSFSHRLSVLLVLLSISAINVQGQVSGVVFIDYDSNGKRTNSNPIEIGVAGVKVQLFVGSNTTPVVTLTDSAGGYQFDKFQAPKDSMIRVEFSGFPETFSPSLTGENSGTDIQFVKAPAENVNLGITNDDEFCNSGEGPKVTTACYVMGDPLAGGSAADDPALVLFDYNASGLAGVDDFSMVKLALAKDIGPTWIASYQRDSQRMLVGAIVRRHVGMGPLGTGGMYYVDLGNGNSVHEFIDVKTLGIDTGPDPHIDPITNLNILPASKTGRSRDSLAFHMAGKAGMGGVQLSRFQDTLFLINLYDKKLYSFCVGKPLAAPANMAAANVKSYTIPHPNCSNGEFVPWALKYYRNKLYIGVVCTAETSQKKEDVKAAIYELSFKDYQFKESIEFPLDYIRDPLDNTQGCDTINTWKPWGKTFPKQCNYPLGAPDPVSAFLVNPQPILSDIEFDDDGSMFIGMMDRGGLQTGQNQPGIAIDDTLNYYGFMSGDLLRAQRNSDGSFTMESNGKSGIYTADGPSGPTSGSDNVKNAHDKNAGPGGGEFFFEDYWINAQDSVGHSELTNGGIFKQPGVPEIFSSAFDPLHKIYLATGFIVFDTQTGKRKRSYAVYSIQEGALGKSGGVGDLTAACDPAPLEIGNRVWFDQNKNGIQDPSEIGIDDVILTLHDMENGGLEVGRDTTTNGGQFYFNDYNVSGGVLKRNHKYEIRMNTNQEISINTASALKAVAGAKNALVNTFILKDSLDVTIRDTTIANVMRNSDAIYNSDSTQVVVAVTTGNNSQNDHNEDIGWMLKPPAIHPNDLELTKIVVGDCKRQVGDEVQFKLIIKNNSPDLLALADSVYVEDVMSPNFTFVKYVSTQGQYNTQTRLWGPLSLNAGQADTLTLTLKINDTGGFIGGSVCNEAEIVAMSAKSGGDTDSESNNGIKTEDDYDIACVSVPLKICTERRDTVIISAPAGYAKYQWFKDQVKIDGATAQTLEVGAIGSYSVEILDGVCPTKNCCPAIVEEECICPPDICIPFTTKKVKKKQNPK